MDYLSVMDKTGMTARYAEKIIKKNIIKNP